MTPPKANKSRYINFALTGIDLLRFQHPDRLIILPLRVETLSLLFVPPAEGGGMEIFMENKSRTLVCI